MKIGFSHKQNKVNPNFIEQLCERQTWQNKIAPTKLNLNEKIENLDI